MKNRAAWVGVIFLGGAFGLIAYLLSRGLPEEMRKEAESQIASIAKGRDSLKSQGEALTALVEADEGYLATQPEVAQAQASLKQLQGMLETQSAPLVGEIEALLSADKHKDSAALLLKLDALSKSMAKIGAGITAEHEAVAQLVSFKENHEEILKRARAQVETATVILEGLKGAEASAVKTPPPAAPAEEAEGAKKKKKLSRKALEAKLAEEAAKSKAQQETLEALRGKLASGFDASALYHEVQAAKATCPTIEAKIQARYATIKALAETITKAGAAMEEKAKADPIDYAGCGRLSLTVARSSDKLAGAPARLLTDLNALKRSEDKILIDMKADPQPMHKYKHVRGADVEQTGWEAVTTKTYSAHKEHLGMTLESKPECTLPEDATKVASPPGYAYVGNPHYGHWKKHQSGARVWIFYSHYSMHRDRLWGAGHYQPVPERRWKGYNASTKQGKTYFGENKQYGTSGSQTKKRYSSSSYITKSRTARSSSAGYRSSGYSSTGSSSSSRGGNYRSSRHSSSSFGGSGK